MRLLRYLARKERRGGAALLVESCKRQSPVQHTDMLGLWNLSFVILCGECCVKKRSFVVLAFTRDQRGLALDLARS